METINQVFATYFLNAIWQIALIALAAAVCARLLRGVRARYRYMLWTTALSLSILLPVLTTSQTFFKDTFTEPPSIPASAGMNQPIENLPALSTVPDALTTSSAIQISPNLAIGLLALYLLFAIYNAARLLRAYIRTRAIVSSAYRTALSDSVRTAFEKCQAVLGVENAELLCSHEIPVPVTIGWHTPVVIIPETLLKETDPDMLVTAIGHELVHVRRRDYAFNLFYSILCLPISFHPATAFLKRRVDQARELCCDEVVARSLLSAEVYARSLVTIAGSVTDLRLVPATTVGITDAGNLEVRIMSLLKRSEVSSYKKSLLIAAVVLLLAIPCVVAGFFTPGVGITGAASTETAKVEPTPPEADEAAADKRRVIEARRERLEHVLKEVQESDLDPREKETRTEKLKLELKMLHESVEKLESGMDREVGEKLEAELKALHNKAAGLDEKKQGLMELERELVSLKAAGMNTDEKKAELDKLRTELKELAGNVEGADEARVNLKLEMARKMEIERLIRDAPVKMEDAMKIALNQHPGKVIEKGIEIERNKEGAVYKFVIRGAAGDTALVVLNLDGTVIKTEKIQ